MYRVSTYYKYSRYIHMCVYMTIESSQVCYSPRVWQLQGLHPSKNCKSAHMPWRMPAYVSPIHACTLFPLFGNYKYANLLNPTFSSFLCLFFFACIYQLSVIVHIYNTILYHKQKKKVFFWHVNCKLGRYFINYFKRFINI